MRIAERICIAIALASLVMKYMHWPVSVLLVLALSALSIVYFALGWLLFRPRKSKVVMPGMAIPAGFVFATAITGILFKLQYWPGSETNLVAGAFLSLVVIAPVSYWLMRKHQGKSGSPDTVGNTVNVLDTKEDPVVIEDAKSQYSRNIFVRALIIGGISVLLYFTPSTTLARIQYRDDPNMRACSYSECSTRRTSNTKKSFNNTGIKS